jgi:hypothetical protein
MTVLCYIISQYVRERDRLYKEVAGLEQDVGRTKAEEQTLMARFVRALVSLTLILCFRFCCSRFFVSFIRVLCFCL